MLKLLSFVMSSYSRSSWLISGVCGRRPGVHANERCGTISGDGYCTHLGLFLDVILRYEVVVAQDIFSSLNDDHYAVFSTVSPQLDHVPLRDGCSGLARHQGGSP